MRIVTRTTRGSVGIYQRWYCNGQRHRQDGPATILKDYMAWALNGKTHRLDGPARIWTNLKYPHDGEYWVDGWLYRDHQYAEAVRAYLERCDHENCG